MAVLLILTEHSSYLDPAAVGRYDEIRRRLEDAAGTPVTARHYEDVVGTGHAAAIVLSGSLAPWAVHDPDAIERLGDTIGGYAGPVLGICAGMQLQVTFAGGSVRTTREAAESSFRAVEVVEDAGLLQGVPSRATFYERHTDEVVDLPHGFTLLARSAECGVEAIADEERRWWGTQFHPEHYSSQHPHGERVLRNFFELAR